MLNISLMLIVCPSMLTALKVGPGAKNGAMLL